MMTTDIDYYTILQVSPDAEREVIDAAYRQLMRKYHPDVAHGDAALAAHLHERAKLINQAYAVVRDARQRYEYDRVRLQRAQPGSAGPRASRPSTAPPSPPPPPARGSSSRPQASAAGQAHATAPHSTPPPPRSQPPHGSQPRTDWVPPQPPQNRTAGAPPPRTAWVPPSPPTSPQATPPAQAGRPWPRTPAGAASGPAPAAVEYEEMEAVPPADSWWVVDAPLSMLASAYYLLPGPYEWDPASKREQTFTWLIPPLGVVSWMAATGRLAPLLGHSPYSVLLVWLVVALVLLIADWRSMPRFAVAGGLALVLASGLVDAALISAGIPMWLGWLAIGGLGVLLAARAFFFGLLPTMGVCWLFARIG